MENLKQENQIQIRASDNDLKGVYSNVMRITHTQEEFILDFLNIVGNIGILSARIIASPSHVKRMILALEENMNRYEDRFGKVVAADTPKREIGFNQ